MGARSLRRRSWESRAHRSFWDLGLTSLGGLEVARSLDEGPVFGVIEGIFKGSIRCL